MKRNNWLIRSAVLMILVLLLGCASALGARAEEEYSAQVMRLLHYEGDVEIEDAGGGSAFIMENIRLSSGQALRTGPESSASVGLDAKKIVTLNAESRVEFLKETDRMEMHLTQGSLFLDVQDKLDENEVLDIRTSTMAVGIRGTIVFVSAEEREDGDAVTLGVLEGTARLKYIDRAGEERFAMASAGQKVTVLPLGQEEIQKQSEDFRNGEIEISKLEKTDLPAYVEKQIEEDPVIRKRVQDASSLLDDQEAGLQDQYSANADWTWDQEVRLVAQSASKMYDGIPLTRTSDVLVYGLPDIFSIKVAANGERTDAGRSENPVGTWHIYNAAGEEVTSHFSNIITQSGTLVVDPAPLTIWTDRAEKVYDGTPLTAPDAALTFHEGYIKNQEVWRNRSYLVTAPDGISYNTQVLYGLCGTTKVHASNPYTGEIREELLSVGQKLTIRLHDEKKAESAIELKIEDISEQEIPVEILRIYAANEGLLRQVCRDTGWKAEVLQERIGALPDAGDRPLVSRDGLYVEEEAAENVMTELTNVRLTVDTQITDYYDRPLGSSEAQFTPVRVDDSIKVRATGSQTDVGTSTNTYEIDWGSARPENYIVQEDLGTLTVLPAGLTVRTGSAEKTYDGSPLTEDTAELTGLVAGESAAVKATGSITNPGSTVNTYEIDWGSAKESNYTITEELGTLTVTNARAELTISTGSASRAYDGKPLTSGEVTITGLLGSDSITVTPTGSITDAGTAENSFTIDWGDTDQSNYVLNEKPGTLTVTPADLTISTGSAEKTYDGTALTNSDVTITGLAGSDTITVTPDGSITDAGTADNTYSIDWGSTKKSNYNLTEETGTLTVTPADLSIASGSAEKTYDGTALTNSEVTVTGLADSDSIRVTPSGSITDAGTEENSFTIEWGSTKKSNYDLTEEKGTLTVTPADLSIASGSAEKTYDGTALTNSDVTITGLADADSITVTPDGSITDVGTADNTYSIDWGSTKQSNYNLTEEKGTLEVSPLPVIFDLNAAQTVNYIYPWVPHGLSVSWGEGEGAAAESEDDFYGMFELAFLQAVFTLPGARASMEIPAVSGAGEHTLEPKLTFTEGKESNYKISYINDTVTLQSVDVIIDLHCSESVIYSGAPYIPEGITAAFSNGSEARKLEENVIYDDSERAVGIEVVFQMEEGRLTLDFSGKKDAGTYVLEEDTASVTGVSVSFSYINNTLTILPAPLTIRTGSASKTYDGEVLKNAEASAEGLCESDSITLKATGSQTDAGSSDNSYELEWGDTDPGNYTVSEELGTLKVDPVPLVFELGCFEVEYSGDPYVPEGIRCLYDGTEYDNEGEDYAYEGDVPASLTAVIDMPTCKVEVLIKPCAFTEIGEHPVTPKLTFLSGSEDNYDISYIYNVMNITEPEESTDDFFGMKMIRTGIEAVTENLLKAEESPEKETKEAEKAGEPSENAKAAVSEDVQDPDQAALPEEEAEEKKDPETEPGPAESGEEQEEKEPSAEEEKEEEPAREEQQPAEPAEERSKEQEE